MSLQSQPELCFSKGHEPYVGAGHVKAAIAAVRSWVQPPCHDQKTLFHLIFLPYVLQCSLGLEGEVYYICPI